MDKNNQINRKSTLIFGLNENGMKSLFKEKFFKYSRSKYFSSTKYANIFITKLQKNQRRIPTIVFEDDTFLVEPSDVELELKLKKLNYI